MGFGYSLIDFILHIIELFGFTRGKEWGIHHIFNGAIDYRWRVLYYLGNSGF